jgi:hypothetical protein
MYELAEIPVTIIRNQELTSYLSSAGACFASKHRPREFNVMPLPRAECKLYTPRPLAEAMVAAIHCGRDVEWLNPCVGPGVFIEALRARGVRKDRIVALDIESAPGRIDRSARTLRGVDFFRWLSSTTARFDKVIANPPYVPIERLSLTLQKPILSLNALAVC